MQEPRWDKKRVRYLALRDLRMILGRMSFYLRKTMWKHSEI